METVKVKELFTNKTERLVPALTVRLLGSCKQSSKDKKDHLEGDFAQKKKFLHTLKILTEVWSTEIGVHRRLSDSD